MIAEVNFFGVYISTALFAAAIAALLHIVVRRTLQTFNVYRFVAHQNLLDVALFIILWGALIFAMSAFAEPLSSILG